MKNVLLTMMFALVLSCIVLPAVAQAAPQNKSSASDNKVAKSDDVIATNQAQESTAKWAEPTSSTVNVTSTPLQVVPKKKQWADASGKRPSQDGWNRCLQNDRCDPRNLFSNQWNRVFGPAYNFGN